MRLWSVHPSMLDRRALIAGWREALLAQRVLIGGTRGYTQHPQLVRFRACAEPLEAIGHYLMALQHEATARGYAFDRARVLRPDAATPGIRVTTGQLAFELAHLRAKVAVRDPSWLPRLPTTATAAPSFVPVPGPVEEWERGTLEP
ncbi:pyrimidine dimer DNA glycosylase/endonuclease V [Microbacterium sp. M3]|uniref:Pyrimidine dimer DNA glycosylase/endonuclease V n=1 Tax=Microbacterium arthrosphaerae TaxID=792652 RepID=A0ABU4GWU1_9MICO|nr:MULTISPECIES: pyrimidine dimer DNA glycosylase/endonuclease V [Microbacterium]MDW4571540.1 pyrimidine dimer DNA glycosylase/endonuclease V [Microbacterium arthrosphaerae]MDW7605395.1 pyrimidine dimer DNA glycosylase/endonuclease V [Microbacterium sp. M3]